MEYITKHCPKCNGELHIPADMTTCICMYCGETFRIPEDKQTEASKETLSVLSEDYAKALKDAELLVKDYDFYMHQFTADRYSGSFEQYEKTGIDILLPAEKYASLSEDNALKAASEMSGALLEVIDRELHKPKKVWDNLDKARDIDQYRFFLAVYTVPMLLHLNYRISQPLADAVTKAWAQKYPKYRFEMSSYERILEGFERKGLCFITSAVCETLDKPEDCYELTAFRHFRDSYMLEAEDRRALVKEYYRIAPAIVTSINLNPDSSKTYHKIWLKYLKPCLKALENNQPEACEKFYCSMVKELKSRYYFL